MDGKAVRGTRHASADGQAAHLLAAADQQASAVLAQARVDGKTNEITQFAPLLQPLDLARAVVTADALHTQREHAEFLVTRKNAHYILVVKKNQPMCQPRSLSHGAVLSAIADLAGRGTWMAAAVRHASASGNTVACFLAKSCVWDIRGLVLPLHELIMLQTLSCESFLAYRCRQRPGD